MPNFDLEYRPHRLADVIGNQAVTRLLKKLIVEGRIADRSLMFGGPKGCGKTSLARIISKAIVCDNIKDGDPCGDCISCMSVASESSDSFEEFDAATQGTVDHMRHIVDGLEYGNLSGKPFVFIMDEAHRLSKQAQDALLKSVEDRRLVVILCTTEPHKIQGAIRSRVTEFPVTYPSESEMIVRMEHVCRSQAIQYEPGALNLIARSVNVCPRNCLTTIELLAPNITNDSVKSHFRYDSLESLVSILERIDSDSCSALNDLESLMSIESSTWVRDNIILAISSAIRVNVGAKATYPFESKFYASRGNKWADLARFLGSIDKPTPAVIETALISNMSSHVSVQSRDIVMPRIYTSTHVETHVPVVPASAPASAPVSILEVKDVPLSKPANSTLEIDGIKFTENENLTSLDSRIDVMSHAQPPLITKGPFAEVELDSSRVPIPDKEFARGFIQRFKKTH